MVPTAEAIAVALATIPEGEPWEWAALRLLPVVRGDRVQVMADIERETLGFEPASAFASVVMEPGLDIGFSIDVDVVGVHVKQTHLDAWGRTADDLIAPAMANLRREVGTWTGSARPDDYEGVPVRTLEGWPAWAASLLLLPDELMRIYGAHDQLFVMPYACNLVSMPIDVDRDQAADLVDMFGLINPRSLLLGLPAVVLRDGVLACEDLPGWPELPDPWRDDVTEDIR